jgi:ubiquitin carboxyl-terminal hydrolase 25/28
MALAIQQSLNTSAP